MMTREQLNTLRDTKEIQFKAVRLLDEVQSALIPVMPSEELNKISREMWREIAYRVALMATLATEQITLDEKEIAALKDERDSLLKQLLPDAL